MFCFLYLLVRTGWLVPLPGRGALRKWQPTNPVLTHDLAGRGGTPSKDHHTILHLKLQVLQENMLVHPNVTFNCAPPLCKCYCTRSSSAHILNKIAIILDSGNCCILFAFASMSSGYDSDTSDPVDFFQIILDEEEEQRKKEIVAGTVPSHNYIFSWRL